MNRNHHIKLQGKVEQEFLLIQKKSDFLVFDIWNQTGNTSSSVKNGVNERKSKNVEPRIREFFR